MLNNEKCIHLFTCYSLLPGWCHQFRQSWHLQLAISLLLPARTLSRTSKSKNAHHNSFHSICRGCPVCKYMYVGQLSEFVISKVLKCNMHMHLGDLDFSKYISYKCKPKIKFDIDALARYLKFQVVCKSV